MRAEQDDWSRFEGASAAIGHFIRMVHEGRMSKDEGWEGICGYNAADAAAAMAGGTAASASPSGSGTGMSRNTGRR